MRISVTVSGRECVIWCDQQLNKVITLKLCQNDLWLVASTTTNGIQTIQFLSQSLGESSVWFYEWYSPQVDIIRKSLPWPWSDSSLGLMVPNNVMYIHTTAIYREVMIPLLFQLFWIYHFFLPRPEVKEDSLSNVIGHITLREFYYYYCCCCCASTPRGQIQIVKFQQLTCKFVVLNSYSFIFFCFFFYYNP